jgi:diguanylate cyclase (GGDEF)-like protein
MGSGAGKGKGTSARAIFARREDPYAGGDIALALRLGSVIGAAMTIAALLALPLAPPTEAIGPAGWLVAAGLLLVSGASVLAMRRCQAHISWDRLLAMSYVGVVQVAVAQWLAGGPQAPYRDLLLFSAVYVGGTHPPRRVAAFLATIGAVVVVPLVFEPWDSLLVAETLMLILIWSALALVSSVLVLRMRSHRIGGEQAAQLARADALTGLGNRRAFDEAIAAEIARARRLESPLTLLLADLDAFKRVNDEHGHLAGDHCLRQVAATFREEVRLADRCFRWGGDEFAALLTDSDSSVAELIAERVHTAVHQRCRQPDGSHLVMTCAYAELADGMAGEDLLAAADAALLALKDPRRPHSIEQAA